MQQRKGKPSGKQVAPERKKDPEREARYLDISGQHLANSPF
jgi:hypothetical protein